MFTFEANICAVFTVFTIITIITSLFNDVMQGLPQIEINALIETNSISITFSSKDNCSKV
jgi:hypothetical protein